MQLKPTSSSNPRKPSRSLAVTLPGRLSAEKRILTSLKHPLKHFFHSIEGLPCSEGPIKLLPLKCKTLWVWILMQPATVKLLWSAWLLADLACQLDLENLALAVLDMGPSITPAWNGRQSPALLKKTAWLELHLSGLQGLRRDCSFTSLLCWCQRCETSRCLIS